MSRTARNGKALEGYWGVGIRVAGNIVAPSQVGSVEFAAEQFGTPLLVVLDHSMCGAVMATIDEMKTPLKDKSYSSNCRTFVRDRASS